MRITKEDAELMAALRKSGMPLDDIAEKWEAKLSTIHKALGRVGGVSVPGPFGNKLNAQVLRIEAQEGRPIAEALRDYAASRYSLSFAAKLMGVAWLTAKKLAEHYGVEFTRGKTAGFDNFPVEKMVAAARAKRLQESGVEHNGHLLSMAEWSRRLGGGDGLVQERIRRGWNVADAVTVPPMVRGFRARKVSRRHCDTRGHVWRRDRAA